MEQCGGASAVCSPAPSAGPLLRPVLPADRLAQLLDRDALAGVERQRLLQDQVLVAEQRERPVAVLHLDAERPPEQADPVDHLERLAALDGALHQEAVAAVVDRDQRIRFQAMRLGDRAVQGGSLDLRQDDGGALVAVDVLVRLDQLQAGDRRRAASRRPAGPCRPRRGGRGPPRRPASGAASGVAEARPGAGPAAGSGG